MFPFIFSIKFLILSLFISVPFYFLGQNTITVKKKSKIEGLYSHKVKTNKYNYFYFNKNGNVSYSLAKSKSKKHYYLLKECAENKDKCYGMFLYNYIINEEYADKGISPFIHIEFYKVSNDSGEFDYKKSLEGELKNEILYIKSNNQWWLEYQFIKK